MDRETLRRLFRRYRASAPRVRPTLPENSAPPRSGLHSAAHPPPASSRSLLGRLRGFHRAWWPTERPSRLGRARRSREYSSTSSLVGRAPPPLMARRAQPASNRASPPRDQRLPTSPALTSDPPATGEVASRTGARVLTKRRPACSARGSACRGGQSSARLALARTDPLSDHAL